MADLVLTPALVISGTGAVAKQGVAGVALVAGKVVYLDPDDSLLKLADADGGVQLRDAYGITLHAAEIGQPVSVHTRGLITIGAAVAPGVAYYVSDTPGGICPIADLEAGDYPTIVGFAVNATQIDVRFHPAGVALA